MRAWCASTPSRPANERRVFLFISLVNFKKIIVGISIWVGMKKRRVQGSVCSGKGEIFIFPKKDFFLFFKWIECGICFRFKLFATGRNGQRRVHGRYYTGIFELYMRVYMQDEEPLKFKTQKKNKTETTLKKLKGMETERY